MKKCLTVVCIVVPVMCLISFRASHGSESDRYVEDFTTTQYKDMVNTTAWWDTVGGELKLFPFIPSIVGTCDTPGDAARGIDVTGDYAVVCDGDAGFHVIDISDPTNPIIIGSCDTPGGATDVTVSGDLAYVADYTSGLQVIYIGYPDNPMPAASCDTPGLAWGVAVSGDHAFVADYTSGLQVIDISDPWNPAIVGTCDTPGWARGVAVSGDHAFVADDYSGLQVIDISDPTNPALAGTYDTPDRAYDITVSGDYAFVADGGSGLQVIDISDPTNPTLAGTCGTPGDAVGLNISGDRAFVANVGSGLQMIDISDPTSPTLAGSCDTPGDAYGLTVSGDYAFVTDATYGLQVIHIFNPANPTLVGTYDTPGAARGVAVSGDHAFVVDLIGLHVIDISDPTSPTLAGTYDAWSDARGVAISGDYAYVADYYSLLQVIDISDPTNPTLAGTCVTPGMAQGVAVSGDHAFVADDISGLQVIDISDPTNPTIAGTCDTPGFALGVAVSGNYAFVADRVCGLQVIFIYDPTNPSIVGALDTPGDARGVTVSGDHAFVADGGSGLRVIDISDPGSPWPAGSYDTPTFAHGVAVSGDHAFVADDGSGLQVIDISDPTSPTLLGTCDTPGYAWGVAVSGDHAFVADATSGLQVIQVLQGEVDSENNMGRSLAVDAATDTILRTLLLATQAGSIAWELSADGGASWQGISPDGNWNQMTVPGIDLLWRSTHVWAPGTNPTVSHLEIDWLVEAALVDSIVDVPDDQGGWVRAHFTRSGRDFPEEATLPIEDYGIWQRVDDPILIAALNAACASLTKEGAEGDRLSSPAGTSLITYLDGTYIQSRPLLGASTFPAGTWEWVATVPAVQQDAYIARVATAADSSGTETNYAVLVVTAHTTTPSIWYVSEPDSGYSVDNIAPGVPTGFEVAYNAGSGTALSWDECPDEDFQYFRIYRDESEDFEPEPGNLVHSTAETEWLDMVEEGWRYYYKITALDHAGNESDAASPEMITGDDVPALPKTFALHQNVPNPFNPVTRIRFDLPRPSHVRLTVYNVRGDLVATLADEYMTEGRKEIGWEAKDNEGRSVASGVYFYRLVADDFVQTRKMVLLR